MFIARIPNRKSPPAILLRQGYREGGKVRTRTLANLSHLPPEQIDMLRRVFKGEKLVGLEDVFQVMRTRPHGHVAAVDGMLRRLGLHTIVSKERTRQRDLVEGMVVARIIDPRSKLATARGLGSETLFTSLGEVLGIEDAQVEDLYKAMDWLLTRQAWIEKSLARRHLKDGSLVLYDLTSTYFEGRSCPLAQLGHSRDGKKDKLQIEFGLLCNMDGCPVAVEVFDGNISDPKTLGPQVVKLKERFGLKRIVVVGDRGMITEARIREDLRPVEGISWITTLRAPAIRKLIEQGAVQLSLFDQRDLAQISHPDYPGERLIVCKNPLLAQERARKREDLLQATQKQLDKIVERTSRTKCRLHGKDMIGMGVGKVLGKYKVAKHFIIEITEDSFSYRRNELSIEAETALDGLYVVRTNVPEKELSAEDTVLAYKSLSVAERAFRSFKSVDLKVRPIHHRLADRVRAHVFLCMLAYYVEWHMRKALAPLLFDDDDKACAKAQRASVVSPAQRSMRAKNKAFRKRTEEGLPVHSFQTLMQDLSTIAKNRIQRSTNESVMFDQVTCPTPYQQKVFSLLGVSLML